MGHETDGRGQRKIGAAGDGNCEEHRAPVSVDFAGWANAGDGRIHAGRTYSSRSGPGGGHDYDADFGGTFGRCGTVPEAGDYGLSGEAGAAKRIAGCDLPFAGRRGQEGSGFTGDPAQPARS